MSDSVLHSINHTHAFSSSITEGDTVLEETVSGSSMSNTPDSDVKKSGQKNKESLAAAFEFFNETSNQLAQTYHLLEQKIGGLTAELDRAHQEKNQQRTEKKQLAGQMQALLECLPGGVIVLDDSGTVMQANPAAQRLLNKDKQHLLGKRWRYLIGETFAPRNDDGLEVSTHDGKRISIATSSMGDAGQIILLTDQTETRRLQQTLHRHERLSEMGKMVSALAHQIRTPLSAAILYAGHLNDAFLESEQQRNFSKKLLSRLMHLEKQVRDMLLFVKGELPLNDTVTVADLVQGLQEAAELPLKTAYSHCVWSSDVDNYLLKCNREALINALMNLINNALHASGDQGELSVSIRCRQKNKIDVLCLSIRDNGTGMSPELLASVNDVFVTTKPQGTGLGLAVVRAVARAHGGSFELKSTVGVGTDATLYIPFVSSPSVMMSKNQIA